MTPNLTKYRIETYNTLKENPKASFRDLTIHLSSLFLDSNLNPNTVSGWKTAFNKGLLLEDGTIATLNKEEDLSLFTLQEISSKYNALKEENRTLKNSLDKLQSLAKDYIVSLSKIIR